MTKPLCLTGIALVMLSTWTSAGWAQPAADAGAASPGSQDAVQEAAHRFERGKQFYREGDYELALIEFDRAFELVPDHRVLYNIGQVCIQLTRYARARSALERYLAEGGAEVPPDRAAAVRADLEMLTQRTAFVTVTVPIDGAEVLVDDKVVGTSPLAEPLLLDAGEHEVVARKPGFEGPPIRITLAGGDQQMLALTLATPVSSPPPSPPPPPRLDPVAPSVPGTGAPLVEPRPRRIWIGWVATGALAASAAAVGALGLGEVSHHQDLKDERGATPDDFATSERRAERLFATADGLGIAAVVAGSTTLVFTLRRERPPAAALGAGVGPQGVTLRGKF